MEMALALVGFTTFFALWVVLPKFLKSRSAAE